MKNKVIVFSQAVSPKLENLKILFAKRGYFDFSFEFLSDLDSFKVACKNAKTSQETTVAICENKFIDEVLSELQQSEDTLSLINEQAVRLQTTQSSKLLFMPLELDFKPFLDDFLPAKEVKTCSIFGKRESFVREKFLDVKCMIFSKTSFLHTVYYLGDIDLSELGDAVFSFEDHSLSEEIGQILKQKNLSLSAAEYQTSGMVLSTLLKDLTSLKSGQIILSEEDFEKFDISKEFLEEKGAVSKDVAFSVAKNMLQVSDIALCVIGSAREAEKSYVAVGNKEQIHLFSSVFYGNRQEITENLCDFALFRLLRFLKEKY